MSRRTKTLIAAIVIVFFWLPVYAIFIAGLQWRILPGAPWYLAGVLLLVSLVIAWVVTGDKTQPLGDLVEAEAD